VSVAQAHTFVLVHGGAHGGWCYKGLGGELRRRGHDVYTPTLSGFGERRHLDAGQLTIEDHVLDVANVITFEDLDEVVLVGHSMGGVTIPLVGERAPERIRRIVWLAAVVLADGESIATHYAVPSEAISRATTTAPDGGAPDPALMVEAFMQDGTAEQKAWVQERLGPTTIASVTAEGNLSRFLAQGLPTGYILALRDQSVPPDLARTFAARLPGARFAEVDAGHNLMITKPKETADALEAMAS
jgi:pimeloyl-ACP methyl ester carboxylesterase